MCAISNQIRKCILYAYQNQEAELTNFALCCERGTFLNESSVGVDGSELIYGAAKSTHVFPPALHDNESRTHFGYRQGGGQKRVCLGSI